MNIDHMKVAVRPMSSVQAIDLGMMMARYWFVPLWKIWLGMALPVFVLVFISLLIFDGDWATSIFWFILWWLKPIYEKPMIAWLGQALFSAPPSAKQSIKQSWRWSSLKQYAFTLLLRHRISLKRQLMLPILMLEKPERKDFKPRLQILSRGQGGAVSWHTIIFVIIETSICVGIVIFFMQLIPTSLMKMQTFFTYMDNASKWSEITGTLFYFMIMSVVAPFYVAGGFAVYLTKRCLLEGWDVELVFKQLSYRYQQEQANPFGSHGAKQMAQHSNQMDMDKVAR